MRNSVTKQHERLIRLAMLTLHDSGLKAPTIHRAIMGWVDDNRVSLSLSNPRKKEPFSRKTYETYRDLPNYKSISNGENVRIIYNFFEAQGPESPFHIRFINPLGIDRSSQEGALAYRLLKFYQSDISNDDINSMRHLHGRYALYREAWMENYRQDYVCNILDIDTKSGLPLLTLTQEYDEIVPPLREEDRGVLLPYKSNLLAITKSKRGLKFLFIHHHDPEFLTEMKCMTLEGHITGISSISPYPSFGFFCVRDEDAVSRIVTNTEMNNDNRFSEIRNKVDRIKNKKFDKTLL